MFRLLSVKRSLHSLRSFIFTRLMFMQEFPIDLECESHTQGMWIKCKLKFICWSLSCWVLLETEVIVLYLIFWWIIDEIEKAVVNPRARMNDLNVTACIRGKYMLYFRSIFISAHITDKILLQPSKEVTTHAFYTWWLLNQLVEYAVNGEIVSNFLVLRHWH